MKQNQVHRKEAPSKEEIPFELSSLNQKLEVSTHSRCGEVGVVSRRMAPSMASQGSFHFRHLVNSEITIIYNTHMHTHAHILEELK